MVAATLTVSGPAGAGGRGHGRRIEIKKVVLELGGSDPFIVMPSADLGQAARVAAFARCINNGQSCIAAKRFIVHERIYDEFEQLFVKEMSGKVVGDPMREETEVGPLASEQQRNDVESVVADAAGKGARVLCGGAAPDRPGFYYEPTVLAGVTPEMRAFGEEVFGPVASLFRGRRHRRGDRPGQRYRVRARRQRLDQRRGGAEPVHPGSGGRDGLHQRERDVLPAAAVWRCQDFGVRPRARPARHPRILQHQDRVDRRLARPGYD